MFFNVHVQVQNNHFPLRYNRNIVESGVKHHKPKPYLHFIYLLIFYDI